MTARALSRGRSRTETESYGTEILEICPRPAPPAVACAATRKRESSRPFALGTEGRWSSLRRPAIAARMPILAWGRGGAAMDGMRAGAAAVDSRSYLHGSSHLDASGVATSRGVTSPGVHLSRTTTSATGGTGGTAGAGGTSLLRATGTELLPGTCETCVKRARGMAATCGAGMTGGMNARGWSGAM